LISSYNNLLSRNLFVLIIIIIAILLNELVGGSAIAEVYPVKINMPDNIYFNEGVLSGTNYMLQAIVSSDSSEIIKNMTVSVDASDYVDSVVNLRLGDLNPGQTKQINLTSIFNPFALSWEGDPPLFVTVAIRFLSKGRPFSISTQLPVIYDKNIKGNSPTGSNKNIVARIQEPGQVDILGRRAEPVRGEALIKNPQGLVRSIKPAKTQSTDSGQEIGTSSQGLPTGAVVYGTVRSILGAPLDNVIIQQRHMNTNVTSKRYGRYTLPFRLGNTSILFKKDGYWSKEVDVDFVEKKPVNLADVLMVPRVDETLLFLLGTKSSVPLKKVGFRMEGNLMDAFVGFKFPGKFPSLEAQQPLFLFIPGEANLPYSDVLNLHRVGIRNEGVVQNIVGPQAVRLDMYVAEEEVPITVDKIEGGKAYQVKPKKPLRPGNYAISNMLQRRMALDIASVRTPVIFPFRTVNYFAPKLLSEHTVPCPVHIDGVIVDDADIGEGLMVDISLSNLANTWYLVKLSTTVSDGSESFNMKGADLPSGTEEIFLIGPSTEFAAIRSAEIRGVHFSRNSILNVRVDRFNEVVAFVLAIDMISRGLFGQALEVEDLYANERIWASASETLGNVKFLTLELLNAVHKKNYKEVGRLLNAIREATPKSALDALKEASLQAKENGVLSSKKAELLKNVAGFFETALEIVQVKEHIDLMFGLAGSTLDAPLDGSCSLFAK